MEIRCKFTAGWTEKKLLWSFAKTKLSEMKTCVLIVWVVKMIVVYMLETNRVFVTPLHMER